MTEPSGGDKTPLADTTEQDYGFVNDFSDYKPSCFRFKARPSREASAELAEPDRPGKRRRHHHGHHHRHKRSKRSEDEEAPDTDGREGIDPETAFRESLFDAMADDEGAAYWEGVYGQPIHIYPNTRPADPGNPGGELEQMSEDEYAAYVRTRMWEKSHQHIMEERTLREEAAKRRREAKSRTEQMESEKAAFDRQMEESLRRGAARKKERAWRDAWSAYARGWEKLSERAKGRTGDEDVGSGDRASRIPWPVRSGKQADVDKAAVEEFLDHAASRQGTENALRTVLKAERVRWHPDRMSHRLGGEVDKGILQSVTAVFQIVDAMYNKSKSAK